MREELHWGSGPQRLPDPRQGRRRALPSAERWQLRRRGTGRHDARSIRGVKAVDNELLAGLAGAAVTPRAALAWWRPGRSGLLVLAGVGAGDGFAALSPTAWPPTGWLLLRAPLPTSCSGAVSRLRRGVGGLQRMKAEVRDPRQAKAEPTRRRRDSPPGRDSRTARLAEAPQRRAGGQAQHPGAHDVAGIMHAQVDPAIAYGGGQSV